MLSNVQAGERKRDRHVINYCRSNIRCVCERQEAGRAENEKQHMKAKGEREHLVHHRVMDKKKKTKTKRLSLNSSKKEGRKEDNKDDDTTTTAAVEKKETAMTTIIRGRSGRTEQPLLLLLLNAAF